ncbi:MAG: sulfatase-like hydrolase/transferase [Oxalobacter formigenes]|nr:sulfatase-like hydrolase/transferase [Oxalobacter formigenes]
MNIRYLGNLRAALFFKTLFKRIGFLLLFAIPTALMFLIIRTLDFLWNNSLIANHPVPELLSALITGLHFDISALAFMLLLPVIFLIIPLPSIIDKYRWKSAAIFLLLHGIPLFFFAFVDIELVPYVKSRLTLPALFLFQEGEKQLFVNFAIQYPLLIFSGVLSLSAWAYAIWKIQEYASSRHKLVSPSASNIVICCIVTAILIIGIRGGISNTKPLRVADTHPDLDLGNWALNTPFTFIKSLRGKNIIEKKYFNDSHALLSRLNGFAGKPSIINTCQTTRPQNVIVIIMESLSLSYMGKINHVKGYTPFIDSLAEKSLFFPNAFANAARSIEGVPAVLGGIPSLGATSFLASNYANARFEGMGTALAKQGYTTAFFHAAKKGSMSFDRFAILAGFQQHFSLEDYPFPSEADSWGIPDEPYFQYVATEIDKMYAKEKPFAAAVFSLSGHTPYHIPLKYENILPEAPHKMLRAQQYADIALRQFFDTVSKKTWFKNTLFVITADHASIQFMDAYRNDPLGSWRIPIIFYHPSISLPNMTEEDPVQQIDILPSILDFLGIRSDKSIPLGRSVFSPGPRIALIRAGEGFYAVKGTDVIFEPDNGKKTITYIRGSKTVQDKKAPDDLLQRAHAAQQYFYESMKKKQCFLSKYPSHETEVEQ